MSFDFNKRIQQRGREPYSLTNSAEQHEFPTTELLNSKDCDERGSEVFCAVQRSKKTTGKSRETDAVFEDSSGVIL